MDAHNIALDMLELERKNEALEQRSDASGWLNWHYTLAARGWRRRTNTKAPRRW